MGRDKLIRLGLDPILGEEKMNWVTLISGIVMFFAPFAFGYSGNPAAVGTSMIVSAILAVLAFLKSDRLAAAVGIVTLVAPFVLGFSGIGAASWTCAGVGTVTILTSWKGLFSEETISTSQHPYQA